MLTEVSSPLTARWSPMIGHALTVVALALGGLSSFHALRAEVVELRSNLSALMNLEADHSRRAESSREEADRRYGVESQHIREDIRDLRADVRELKQSLTKGDKP